MSAHRVLVTDALAESGLAILRAASDVDLDYRPGLKGEELLRAVSESDALITRSGTAVTRELVSSGKLRPELVTTDLAAIDDAPRAIKAHMHGEATKTILVDGA